MTKSLMRLVAATTVLVAIVAIRVVPAQAQTTNATVNATSSLGVIPPAAHGINVRATVPTPGGLTDPHLPGLLTNLGTNALRFPGGIDADSYHWANNTLNGQGCPPTNSFDNFIALAKSVGATPIITTNYRSPSSGNPGDPTEAAAWVAYSKSKGDNVKYWEIGNEEWGYGQTTNTNSLDNPTYYGKSVAACSSAMKAQDPTIKIGAVLTNPGSPYDGYAPDWNSNVLTQCGASIDFVILHYYPAGAQPNSDPALLGYAAPQIPLLVARTRALINRYCGANAPNIQILITETNSTGGNASQQITNLVNSLFVADETQLWLENGVANVDFWVLYNGMSVNYNNNPQTVNGVDFSDNLYGNYDYVDGSLLAWGKSDGGYYGFLPGTSTEEDEPSTDTPFPTYYGEEMVALLGKPGDFMVASATDQPLVSSHAVKNANGNLSVMLVNKDPNSTYTANVAVKGYAASFSTPSTVYFYGESNASVIPSTSITSSSGTGGSSFSQSLPPYSITTVVLTPAPAAPLFTAAVTPAAAAVASSATTNIGVSVTDSGAALSNGTTTVEVFNLTGTMVASTSYSGQNWSAGQVKTYTYAWSTPSILGTYYVSVQVTDSTGSTKYYCGNNLATFMVTSNGSAPTQPAFTMTATAFPNPVAPGETMSITYSYTDTGAALTDATMLEQAYLGGGSNNPLPINVSQLGVNWVYGQTQSYVYTAIAPGTQGTYYVEGGVEAPDWSQQYAYVSPITSFTVSSSAPMPAFTATSSAAPNPVAPGAVSTITASITDSGGALCNGITGLQIRNSSNQIIVNQQYTGQNWNNGTTYTYTYPWTTPTTPGTYSVYFPMVNAGQTECYTFLGGPSITVAPQSTPAFSGTSSASPSTVMHGTATTITASITNNGGALSNGVTQVQARNSSNQIVWSQVTTGQNWNNGTTRAYSWPWTPSTPGTYTVYISLTDSTQTQCYTFLGGPTITVN